MKRLVLTPKVGIGPIKLGARRSDIRSEMSAFGLFLETERDSMDYFGDASIQVEYEEDGAASFIGVSSDPEVELFFEGIDLFDLEAKKVFDLLASRDDSGQHEFSECEYLFPSQIITLYEADAQYDRKNGEMRSDLGPDRLRRPSLFERRTKMKRANQMPVLTYPAAASIESVSVGSDLPDRLRPRVGGATVDLTGKTKRAPVSPAAAGPL